MIHIQVRCGRQRSLPLVALVILSGVLSFCARQSISTNVELSSVAFLSKAFVSQKYGGGNHRYSTRCRDFEVILSGPLFSSDKRRKGRTYSSADDATEDEDSIWSPGDKLEQDWNNIFTEEKSKYALLQSNEGKLEKGNNRKKRFKSRLKGAVEVKDQGSDRNESNVVLTESERPLQKTLPGGQSLLFQMIRQFWNVRADFDGNDYDGGGLPRGQQGKSKVNHGASGRVPVYNSTLTTTSSWTLPRWRPYDGVSPDINESFRSSPPKMTVQAYYSIIRRNSRKKGNKKSLWKYAIRTFDKCLAIEQAQEEQQQTTNELAEGNDETLHSVPSTESSLDQQDDVKKTGFKLVNSHYEAALVACAKLGDWEKAADILKVVIRKQNRPDPFLSPVVKEASSKACGSSTSQIRAIKQAKAIDRVAKVEVTDSMVLSLVNACVRASTIKWKPASDGTKNEPLGVESRRVPLDTARKILSDLTKTQNNTAFSLDVNMVTPLAAAYQRLGLLLESESVIRNFFSSEEPQASNGETERNESELNEAAHSLIIQNRLRGFFAEPKDSQFDLPGSGQNRSAPNYAGALNAMKEMHSNGMTHSIKDVNLWHEALSSTKMLPKGNRRLGPVGQVYDSMGNDDEAENSARIEIAVLKAIQNSIDTNGKETTKKNDEAPLKT